MRLSDTVSIPGDRRGLAVVEATVPYAAHVMKQDRNGTLQLVCVDSDAKRPLRDGEAMLGDDVIGAAINESVRPTPDRGGNATTVDVASAVLERMEPQ